MALDAFETAMVAQRAAEPFPVGRISVTHYKALHRHLFQDVYRWAGRFRTVRIVKGDSSFCYPENIDAQMRRLLGWLRNVNGLRGRALDGFRAEAAHFLAELNAIHPFRDGNGRTQLAFMRLVAARAGHVLDVSRIGPESFLAAMIASFHGDEGPLCEQIGQMIGRR